MDISSNNWWVKFAAYSKTEKPKSLCVLFWHGIFGFILFILNIPMNILIICVSIYDDDIATMDDLLEFEGWKICFAFYFLSLLVMLCGHLGIKNYVEIDNSYLYVFLTFIAGIAIIIGAIFLWEMVSRFANKVVDKDWSSKKPEKKNVAIEYAKAAKNKICPIINYTD